MADTTTPANSAPTRLIATFSDGHEGRARRASVEVQAHLNRDWNTGDHARETSSVLFAGRFDPTTGIFKGMNTLEPQIRNGARVIAGSGFGDEDFALDGRTVDTLLRYELDRQTLSLARVKVVQ